MLLFGAIAAGVIATAQADEQPKGDASARPQIVMVYNDGSFQWAFDAEGNTVSGRSELDSLLIARIEAVDITCRLTDAQKQKLKLAGRGDIKRFFDRVNERMWKKFQSITDDLDINDIRQIQLELRPLQLELRRGVFDDGSLFDKTLKTTLTAEQTAKYRKISDEVLRYLRFRVELAVESLNEALALRDDQKRTLERLLLEEVQPPAKSSSFDVAVVLFQAAKLPEARFRAILDDNQWRLLNQRFTKIREMEPLLREGGYLPE